MRKTEVRQGDSERPGAALAHRQQDIDPKAREMNRLLRGQPLRKQADGLRAVQGLIGRPGPVDRHDGASRVPVQPTGQDRDLGGRHEVEHFRQ
jgi:hypothetical protein